MTMQKKYIEDENGNKVLPITHFSAVRNSSGDTLEDVLYTESTYDPTTYSGMGRKVLQKNMVNGVNTLTQDMMPVATGGNTIYIIRYDFTLGEDITVPANCVLEFDGGSITASGSNDAITGNNTSIKAGLVKIFNTDVTLFGTWNVAEAYPEWFGAKGDGVTDDTLPIQKAASIPGILKFGLKTYIVTNTITINKLTSVYGSGFSRRGVLGSVIKLNSSQDIPLFNVAAYGNNNEFRDFMILGYDQNETDHSNRVGTGIYFGNSSVTLLIENVAIKYFKTAIYFDYCWNYSINLCIIDQCLIGVDNSSNGQTCSSYSNSAIYDTGTGIKGMFGDTGSIYNIDFDRCGVCIELTSGSLTSINCGFESSGTANAPYRNSIFLKKTGVSQARIIRPTFWSSHYGNKFIQITEDAVADRPIIIEDIDWGHTNEDFGIVDIDIPNDAEYGCIKILQSINEKNIYFSIKTNNKIEWCDYKDIYRNILNYNYIKDDIVVTRQGYTETFTISPDHKGKYYLNGTSINGEGGVVNIKIGEFDIIQGNTYSISGMPVISGFNRGEIKLFVDYTGRVGGFEANMGEIGTHVASNTTKASVYLTCYKRGITLDNVEIAPIICCESTIVVYKPFSYKPEEITRFINNTSLNIDAITSGTTSQRPSSILTSSNIGFIYFDTTLGKPIWYDGTNWRDAAGTPV